MVGTRGIPASYSGFETCVEELGSRLVERGHQVTVYCRSHHITADFTTYRGMRLVKLPTIRNKYLDTIVHTTLSCLHLSLPSANPVDVVLMFIAGNSPAALIPRLTGKTVILNVDGLDWKREKWPALAKQYIRFAEFLATRFPHAIVTDSRVVQAYYQQHYRAASTYIAYGSEVTRRPPGEVLARYGLTPGRYILFVGRLVPENCAHHLVQAFAQLPADLPYKCVIVGDAPYADDYIRALKATSHPNIIFTGYAFGAAYQELGSNAGIFVETSGVGGTHPALVEAMAFGNCVVVNDTPENLETIGDAGLSYAGKVGADALRDKLLWLFEHPEAVANYRQRAESRARMVYSWQAITDAYEQLFYQVRGKPG